MGNPARFRPLAVMAAQFWPGSTGAGIAAGLRQLGWDVQEIDIRYFGPPLGLPRYLRALNRFTLRRAAATYRERIVADCRLLRPDLFLTVKGVWIDPPTLAALADIRVRTGIYYPDVNFEFANFDKTTIALYDDFATTKTFQLPFLREQRPAGAVHYIPHGYCSAVHHSLYAEPDPSNFICQVGYAGNYSPYKAEQLGRLLQHLPNLDLKVTGPNWERMSGRPDLSASLDREERRNLAYADFLQRSQIGLSFHYGATQNGWADLVSTRTFEIPACGSFMLHVENDEVHEFYDKGTEIDTFSSSEELADKVEFYLRTEDLRRRMAQKAYARTVPAYSYEQRARELMLAMGLPAGTA